MTLLLSGVPTRAQDGDLPILQAEFVSDPPARVYRRDGEGNYDYLGKTGQLLTLDLDRLEAAGDRDLVIDFQVDLWGKTWTSPTELISVPTLRQSRRFPEQGAHRLSLSRGQRFQAFTRAHPLGSLLALLLPLAGGLAIWRMRTRPKVDPRDPTMAINMGGYVLGERLGAGAMGEVFAATSSDGLECALKFLRPEVSGKSGAAQRFDREIAASIELDHPNLLRVFGYGYTGDGRLYLSTERLHGQTLKDLLKSGAERPPELALRVAEHTGSALAYLHERSLIHRDVKPENIFVRKDSGAMVLMDLGLAQDAQMESFTLDGKAMGTPAYMSPEQVRGQPGIASDQYALGVVLYEILTGKRPFRGLDAAAVAHQQIHQEAQPLRELEPRVPVDAEAAVLKMLSKDPGSRFPDVTQARLALRQALQNQHWTRE